MNAKERKTLQFRVCVVLQQWIKLQFSDFTPPVLAKLIDFLDNEVQKIDPGMREDLHFKIEKKVLFFFFFKQLH